MEKYLKSHMDLNEIEQLNKMKSNSNQVNQILYEMKSFLN